MKRSLWTRTALFGITLVLLVSISACQSARYPVDRYKTIEYGNSGRSYYQDGRQLSYDSVQLALLRNYRSRILQVRVQKFENNAFLAALNALLVPIPFYVMHDAALRREAVEAFNESIELGEFLVDVPSWEAAGFISFSRQGTTRTGKGKSERDNNEK